jgi:hypothetical protein
MKRSRTDVAKTRQFILDNYLEMTASEMQFVLNVSSRTIRDHASRIGVKCKKPLDRKSDPAGTIEYINSQRGEKTILQLANELRFSYVYVFELCALHRLPYKLMKPRKNNAPMRDKVFNVNRKENWLI